MSATPRQRVIGWALVAAGVMLALSVASGQRPQGDDTAAALAIGEGHDTVAVIRKADAAALVPLVGDPLELFLASDSARRMPEPARLLRDADLALHAAAELKRLAARGNDQPSADEAPQTALAARAVPDARSVVPVAGPIDNTGGRAMETLLDVAHERVHAAATAAGFSSP